MEVPLPWEHLLWSCRSVWPPGARYVLTDFRLVRVDGHRSSEIAVHDIGEVLGCGAHLKSLRRTKSGRFDVTNAITVDEIKNATPDQILKRMLSLPEVSRMRGA